VKDAEGRDVITMCRHCRACGKDYYIDEKEQFERRLSSDQRKFLDQVMALREKNKEKEPEHK